MEVIHERLTDLTGRLGRIETMLAGLVGQPSDPDAPPPTRWAGRPSGAGVTPARASGRRWSGNRPGDQAGPGLPQGAGPLLPNGDEAVRAEGGGELKSYLSVEQVVRRLNGAVSGKLVYKLVAAGKLRANRATGKLLIEEDSLVELMEGQARPPPAPELPPPPRRPRGRPKKRREADLW